jgi:hypothetical protein
MPKQTPKRANRKSSARRPQTSGARTTVLTSRRRQAQQSTASKAVAKLAAAVPSAASAKKATGKKPAALALVGLLGLAVKNRDKLPGRGSHAAPDTASTDLGPRPTPAGEAGPADTAVEPPAYPAAG